MVVRPPLKHGAASSESHDNGKSPFSLEQTHALLHWLKTVPPTADDLAKSSDVRLQASAFSYGQSNPTYLVSVIVPKSTRQFILRSKPHGDLLPGAHRIDREYRVLYALVDTPVPVPVPYAYCKDCSILGVEFYIMSYASGTIFKSIFLTTLSDSADRTQVFMEALRILFLLRSLDISQLGLTTLSRPTPSWVDRQIDTWYKQYRASRINNFDYSSIELLHARLNKVRLIGNHGEDPCCLVHGDFRIDNLVFNRINGRLMCTAVLDWELVALGNPLADLASLLSPYYLHSISNSIASLYSTTSTHPDPAGIPRTEDLITHYVRDDPDGGTQTRKRLKFYVAVASFRFSAIFCGVLYRAHHGNAASPYATQLGKHASDVAEDGLKLLENYEEDYLAAMSQTPSQTMVEILVSFMDQEILPLEQDFTKHTHSDNRWSVWPPIEILKSKAKSAGLWNLFLPKALGGSLTCEEYAPLAENMGRCVYAAEVFNCSAPDTGRSRTSSNQLSLTLKALKSI